MDTSSVRGKRTVSVGIANPAGLALLKGFNFNKNAILSSVLFATYKIEPAAGSILIDSFVPANDVTYPNGATHLSLQSSVAVIDFSTGDEGISYSPVTELPINRSSTNVNLTPAGIPAGRGSKLYILHIGFSQEINGVQYPLKTGNYNVLSVVEVG